MWIWKVTAEKSKFGFFRIPKNCVNAEWGNFEKTLEYDDKKEVKSAVVNWFNHKHNYVDFWVGMNGYDFINLMADGDKESIDIYFMDFQVYGDYLVHYDGEKDWLKNRSSVNRIIKLDKIANRLKKNEQKSKESHCQG